VVGSGEQWVSQRAVGSALSWGLAQAGATLDFRINLASFTGKRIHFYLEGRNVLYFFFLSYISLITLKTIACFFLSKF
jgi:hypothetical protein